MEFVKAFNAQTQGDAGTTIPVEITVYEDRSFTFVLKTPPAAVLIKQAISLDKGSAEPHREKVGKISQAQLRDIAERKMADLNANDVDAAAKIIAGTARSMGVDVVLMAARQGLSRRPRASRPRARVPARRGARARQGPQAREVRRSPSRSTSAPG